MRHILLITTGLVLCAGCVAPKIDQEALRAKTERRLRGVWESREFATSDWEFAHYTNLTVYIYRVGKFRTDTNDPIIAEVIGAFVYKQGTNELRRFPVQLARGNRIRVGWFMNSIWPCYSFKNGSLILELDTKTISIANSSELFTSFYRAVLDKVSDDPGDPEKLLPASVIRSQEDY
jgi:hypothetical protein